MWFSHPNLVLSRYLRFLLLTEIKLGLENKQFLSHGFHNALKLLDAKPRVQFRSWRGLTGDTTMVILI